MATHNKRASNPRLSFDLERLKRSPYLVSPILSPKYGAAGVHVLSTSRTTSPRKISQSVLPPRNYMRKYEDHKTRVESAGSSTTNAQGLSSLCTITERYFTMTTTTPPKHSHHTTRCSSANPQPSKSAQQHLKQGQVQALNINEYYLAGGKLAPPHCPDFIGPVTIQQVGNGMGRGLVLDADVEPGNLLLVSNALAKLCKQETNVAVGGAVLEENSLTLGNVLQEQLIRVLCTRAASSSHDRALLMLLCKRRGENLPIPPMDMFCSSRVKCEDTTRSPSTTSPASINTRGGVFDIDHTVTPELLTEGEIESVVGVVRCNAFGHTGMKREGKQKVTRSWSRGIWMLPSFLNHSCAPNCAMVAVGDALFVVAARKMRAGMQLTVAYFDIFRPLEERRISMHRWDFECSCKRCKVEDSLHDSLARVSRDYGFRDHENDRHTLRSYYEDDTYDNLWWQERRVHLVRLAEQVQAILEKEPGLSNLDKHWIRGSFLLAYLADGKRMTLTQPKKWRPQQTRISFLQIALDATEAICRGQEQTLRLAATFLERARTTLGNQSFLVKAVSERALMDCRRLFGRLSEDALLTLLKAVTTDSFPPDILFLSQN